MPSYRLERVANVIKQRVSQVIMHELSDPRLGFVTVMKVKVTPDLKECRVHVSVLGSDADAGKSMAALHEAARYVQKRVGEALTTRVTPRLSFELSQETRRIQRVNEILGELARERDDDQPEPDEPESTGEDDSADDRATTP